MIVSIIILNFNQKELSLECLKSVLNQTYQDFEIIFVDNGSQDGSFEFIKSFISDLRVHFYKTEKNIGFAGGNNFGLKFAKGKYIVLLNNDTKVEKDWLKYLVETIESGDNIGIVQSLVYTEGIPLKYYEKNGTINLLGHNIMRVFDIDAEGIGKILLASGTSMIFKKELIEKTNVLFPDEYFLYAEDTYLSLKAKFAGYDLLHTSKSVVSHIGSGTTKNLLPSGIYFYQERNRLLNFLIFFNRSFIIKYIPVLIFNFKLKFIYCLFSNKYSLKGLLRTYKWFIFNRNWIKQKRLEISKLKKIPDNEVLKMITSKITNGENISGKILNGISYLYCKLLRIRILENKSQ